MKYIPYGLRSRYMGLFLKNKLLEYRSFVTLFIIFILTLFILMNLNPISMFFRKLETLSNQLSQNALISTLIGAIVGGIFTLLGSFLATKSNIKLQANIKQSQVIYAPIYDEINQNIKRLKEQPFPLYELIKSKRMPTHIYYDAWDRISNDHRYLEVNQGLEIYMELLYRSIEEYQLNISNFIKDNKINIGSILVKYEILKEENVERSNFVEILFSEVLVDDDLEYLNTHLLNMEVDKEKLHKELKEKITTATDFNNLCSSQKKWFSIQLFGERYVGEMIKNVHLRQVK